MKKKILLMSVILSMTYSSIFANNVFFSKETLSTIEETNFPKTSSEVLLGTFDQFVLKSQCLDFYLVYVNAAWGVYQNATAACIRNYPDDPDNNLSCQFAAGDMYFMMHAAADHAYDICKANEPQPAY